MLRTAHCAVEISVSGQVSVPADLKEMFEEMVESLALGSKAPPRTCVVSKQDKQVVPTTWTNVHRLATCSYCFYPLLANLCYLLLRVPGVFCIFLFVLFAASKRRHCWQSSAGRKSSFSLHCAKEVPMSSSSRPMLPHSTHTRPRLSKTLSACHGSHGPSS